ncbi:hypothetical protein [Streptacidiphilus sp. PAMC 29251]
MFTADPAVLRTLVVAASVGAFAGAVLLRLREHAGDVELEAEIAARTRDESRFEDRVAELEYQAETAEEQVKRLDRRLLAQRAQITRIESENARLLRDRARAAAEQAARETEEAHRRELAARGSRPTATAYLKAAAALRGLERRAAVGQAQRIAAASAAPPAQRAAVKAGGAVQVGVDQSGAVREGLLADPATAAPAPLPSALDALATARQHPAQDAVATPAAAPEPEAEPQPAAKATPAGPAWARAALPPMRPASAVLPTALTRSNRQSRDLLRKDAGSGGTFNFFSRQEAAISNGLGDLADVVGDEAAAAQQLYAGEQVAAEAAVGGLPDPVHDRTGEARAEDVAEAASEEAELVDLTADDETEPIDVRALRAI